MTRLLTIICFLLLALAPLQAVYAQDLPEDCDIDDLEACVIGFPLFCQNETTGTLTLGVSEKGTITFSAQFSGKSPWKKFQLFFVKASPSAGGSNEQKVTSLDCSGSAEDGKFCFGEITVAEAEAVSNNFDTEATVIRTALRIRDSKAAKRDRCYGTFTNNTEEVVLSNRLVRRYCSFTTLEDPNLTGEGFFDPRGYGARPSDLDEATEATYDSHFHLDLTGFPTNSKLRGCLQEDGTNKFQEVFSFQSWEVNRTDDQIYKRFETDTEKKLTFEAQDYSYDLSRSLVAQSSKRLDVSKDLSKVNLQISRPSASKESQKVNRGRKSKRQKKRDKKANNSRSRSLTTARSLSYLEANSDTDDRKKDSAINWLSFDPGTNRTVYLARKCNKETPNKAFGTITCGNDVGDGRVCKMLTPTDSQSGLSGIFCYEHRDGNLYHLVTTRVLGLTNGVNYTVCLDGVEVSETFTPIGDAGSTYATLELTDSDTVAAAVPSVKKSSVDINNFDALTVGTGGCDTPLLSGALSNEK